MPQPKTPKKPPEIITRLARQLRKVIVDELTGTDVHSQRHPLKDRFAIRLMQTLSASPLFREELLFRDYHLDSAERWLDYVLPNGKSQKLHTESIYFVQAVLGRRLTIVSQHKSLPNNLHLLLLMLCRYSLDGQWLKARIKRRLGVLPVFQDSFFLTVAKRLQRQCAKLKPIGAVSCSIRERYGPLYLIAQHNHEELPEALSLFDVLDACPAPLNTALNLPPPWFLPLLERLLVSLNSYYGLLRSCGLPPQQWGETVSIGKLTELKELKKTADAYLDSGGLTRLHDAYQQAFAELKPCAGFADFYDFAGSAVGAAMLQIPIVPFSADPEQGVDFTETIASDQHSSPELDQALANLLENHADSFTPVTAYFFQQAVVLQKPVYGEDGVLNDPFLRDLLADDPAYSRLPADKQLAKLLQRIGLLVTKHSGLVVRGFEDETV